MKKACSRHPSRTMWSLAAGFVLVAAATSMAAPPAMVADINPGDAFPDRIAALGSIVMFVADDGTNGVELWRSDGSVPGTYMVADIDAGGDSDPGAQTGLVVFGGAVYFDADDGTNGVELWKSDGTGIGTTMVKDIALGGDSNPTGLVVAGDTLFFAADDGVSGAELWKSDGTGPNTTMVDDINAGGGSNPVRLTDVNGTLFFVADDGTTGNELWKSDGSTATLVSDIAAVGGSGPNRLVNVAGTVFFAADDGVNGNELWKSDGTGAGTSMVKDIRSGLPSSGPGASGGMVNHNGVLVFDANDGVSGRELWKSDGTASGTVLLKDINVGGGSSPGTGTGYVDVNGTLFFDADDGVLGAELWKSDGTTGGTVLVEDIEAGGTGSDPIELENVNGTAFFNACDSVSGCELWMSDGTAAGTALVADLQPGIGDSDPLSPTNALGELYFSADDGTNGVELWSLEVCTAIDPLLPGCVPADSDAGKCGLSLGKRTVKLLSADRKCAAKNSSAAVKLGTYSGQYCEDVARYRFLAGISSMQLKDPACVPACFGSGDADSRAIEIEAFVDALGSAIYCDATSGVPQDDGFGGYVPTTATQSCSDSVAKLAGTLTKKLAGCNARKVNAVLGSEIYDLAACQDEVVADFDADAAGLSGCPACLQASAIRDAVIDQVNLVDVASAYCISFQP